MPDVPVEPADPSRYRGEMESRVAVLEQIARTTSATLEQLLRGQEAQGAELRAMGAEVRSLAVESHALRDGMDRLERRFDMLATDQHADFRWLMGVMLATFTTILGAFSALLGVVAHGFHWL